MSRQKPTATKENRLRMRGWSFIALIIVLVGGIFYLYKTQGSSDNNVSLPLSTSQGLQPLKTNVDSVGLDYVTIPTGVNEEQEYPMDGASVARGNYIYVDTSGPLTNSSAETGGKLIYDQGTIYSGKDLATNNFAISQNGLHYEYMRYDEGNIQIYTDSKLVKTISDQPSSSTVSLYGISDSGTDYAYSYSPSGQGLALYMNGTALYANASVIENADFSSNLSHYVAVVQIVSGTSVSNEVVLDGKVLGTGIQASISSNGLHYIYIAGGNSNGTDSVIVDGNKVGSLTLKDGDSDDVIVNNNGSYAYTDYVNSRVDIKGKYESIPSSIPYDCGTSCVNLFAVNQSATNYIVGDERPVGKSRPSPIWDLDGKNVKLAGDIEALEFKDSSNDLYVYKWSN